MPGRRSVWLAIGGEMARVQEKSAMADTLTAINSLTEVQVVAAVRQLNRRVFSDLPFDAVKAVTTASDLKGVSEGVAAVKLDPATSTAMSRQLLRAFAGDPALAPLVGEVVDAVQEDDSLFIETAIALGLLVNLTMFMASSELTFTTGKLTIKKGPVGADLVKTIVEPVVELIKKLPALS